MTHHISDPGNKSATFAEICGLGENQDVLAKDCLTTMNCYSRDTLVQAIAFAMFALIHGIDDLDAGRTEDIKSYFGAAPNLLSNQLILVLPQNFFSNSQRHQDCLEKKFSANNIKNTGRQHKTL